MFLFLTKIVYVMGLAMINTISHRVTKCGRNVCSNTSWLLFDTKMNMKMLIETDIVFQALLKNTSKGCQRMRRLTLTSWRSLFDRHREQQLILTFLLFTKSYVCLKWCEIFIFFPFAQLLNDINVNAKETSLSVVDSVKHFLNQPSRWYAWKPAMKLFHIPTESRPRWLRVEWPSTVPVVIERRMTHRGRGLSWSKRTSLTICTTTEIDHGYRIDHITVVRRTSYMALNVRFVLGDRKSKQMTRPWTLTMHKISSLWTSRIVKTTTMVTHLFHSSRI